MSGKTTSSERKQIAQGVRRAIPHQCVLCKEWFSENRKERYSPHWRYIVHMFHEHRNLLCAYFLTGGHNCNNKCSGIWGIKDVHFCAECRERRNVIAVLNSGERLLDEEPL